MLINDVVMQTFFPCKDLWAVLNSTGESQNVFPTLGVLVVIMMLQGPLGPTPIVTVLFCTSEGFHFCFTDVLMY